MDTDPRLLDLERIHAFLARSYWAKDIPAETVKKSIQHSLNFGLYFSGEGFRRQIGFARVVSDYATFAYLGDVYIEPEWRGKGLSKWLIECVVSHPDLQGLRRFCLATWDAHGLYQKYGFKVVQQPENWLEIKASKPYPKSSS